MNRFNRHKNIFNAFLCILLAALFWAAGCSKPSPDPLKGWTFRPFQGYEMPPYGHNNNHLDHAITHDYQDFITKEKLHTIGAITGFFEGGAGQHAIEFEAFPYNQHASWHYVLIMTSRIKGPR